MSKKTLPLIAFILLSIIQTGCNNQSKEESCSSEIVSEKETYVLVHSAWLGAWQWSEVAQKLREKGHTVITPDLPAHGKDSTPNTEVTMESYVNTITNIIDEQEQNVILVGHSFNGITISRVAELRTEKIKSLVYLTAFIIPNGESFFSAVAEVENSIAVNHFYLSEDNTLAYVEEEYLQEAFAHDIPKDAFERAKPYIVAEPVEPLSYQLKTSEERFGKVTKYYIECTEDRAIPIDAQRTMYEGKVKKVYSLNSSHTPNFSQPENLANILLNLN